MNDCTQLMAVDVEKIESISPSRRKPFPEENSSDACRDCPGYCCRAFTFPAALSGQEDGMWFPEELCESFGEDYEFVRDNFVRIGENPDPNVFENMEWKASCGVMVKKQLFTCRCYDWETGRCGAYEKRPALCRNYVCSEALEGKHPEGPMFEKQGESHRKELIELCKRHSTKD